MVQKRGVTGRHTLLSAKGRPFFLMALSTYNKTHRTGIQRVAHLQQRGLVITNPNLAAKKIDLIGYERLRIYFISRRQTNLSGRPFVPGTTYKEILRLYKCDSLLRDICFTTVGNFELLLRNAMSEALSSQYGSHPYDDPTAFKNLTSRLDAFQSFMSAYSSSKDQRAKHYSQTYGAPILPPIWTIKEFLTFGRTVRIYKCLNGTLRTQIASVFTVPSDDVFTNWLECLVDLRNACAHHDRLFNRSFQKQPKTLQQAPCPTAPRQKLKAILECLDYLLDKREASANIVIKVRKILNRFPEVQLAEVGY